MLRHQQQLHTANASHRAHGAVAHSKAVTSAAAAAAAPAAPAAAADREALRELKKRRTEKALDAMIYHGCEPRSHCYCDKDESTRIDSPYNWNWLERIVCISVNSRSDRQKNVEEEFHRVGLCNHVLFYRPQRDSEDPVRGCWESHRRVMMDALRKGAKHVCIFEDDVKFRTDFRGHLLNDMRDQFQQLPKDWNSYMLGHWPFLGFNVTPTLRRTVSMTTHAYVANKPLMKLLKKSPHSAREGNWVRKMFGSHYDAVDGFVRRAGNQYAYYRMAVYQSGAKSSITNGDFYEFFLSDPKYMRWAETIMCDWLPFAASALSGAMIHRYFQSDEPCIC